MNHADIDALIGWSAVVTVTAIICATTLLYNRWFR